MNLQNSWMNNATFLACMAHSGWGGLLLANAWLFGGLHTAMALAMALVLAAAVKEFWYDARYEIPKQTWRDNTLDFAMYCSGILLESAVLFVLTHR